MTPGEFAVRTVDRPLNCVRVPNQTDLKLPSYSRSPLQLINDSLGHVAETNVISFARRLGMLATGTR